MLTEEMRRLVEEQRLGFVATVCPDGTPNLSPKGTVAVWDDDHLVFVDICSPSTVANLRANPAVEVNVVDPFARRGYRFKGTGIVLADGPAFAERSPSSAPAAAARRSARWCSSRSRGRCPSSPRPTRTGPRRRRCGPGGSRTTAP